MSHPFQKALASGLGQIMTAVRVMRHPGQMGQFGFKLKRTRFDYKREIGNGLDSSVLLAPIFWIQRALPEAKLAMCETKAEDEVEELDDHEMLALIQNPNRFYGDIALWMATILSFLIDGNAYWIKVRNGVGKPIQLWWVPWWMIEPKAPIDGSDFIEYYEYMPGTGAGRMPIAVEDVVHFRFGINPENLMKGISPINAVIREIFTDIESSTFIASLLRNMGVPGVIISPKGGAMPTPDDVKATKTWFDQAFGGDNRGKPMVQGAPTEVSQFGFNPEQMNLRHGSDRAEERVCAIVGVPAAVVGFGAGLQQTKVGATMEELRRIAWHNGVLPYAEMLLDELKRSLLPDFQRGLQQRSRKLDLYWDTDRVRALQEDEDKKSARKLKEWQSGAITLFEYRQETGRDADDTHRYYMRRPAFVLVPEGEAPDAPDEGEEEEDEEPDPEGAKALTAPIETKHSHDFLPADAQPATEEQVERGGVFVSALEKAESAQFEAFERSVMPVFERWGDDASRAAQVVLTMRGEKAGLDYDRPNASLLQAFETKASDAELIQAIIELLNFEAWEEDLSAKYQAEYVGIARQVAAAIEQSGYGTMMPDLIMRQVIAEGGTRAGLIDIDAQTRKAIFDALAEGRAEGEGVQALANRIANSVEGGRYNSAEARAKLIARIETKHAQNVSTIRNGAANGFSRFIVFDGRLGPGRSEESHIARSGMIVSTDNALLMTANMRPNCTLSFAPHIEL